MIIPKFFIHSPCQERELQAERERLERLKATKEEQAELVGSWWNSGLGVGRKTMEKCRKFWKV